MLVYMICVVWGVMCQYRLGLMGAMLFIRDMVWVLFMKGCEPNYVPTFNLT